MPILENKYFMQAIYYSNQQVNRLNNLIRNSTFRANVAIQKMPTHHRYLEIGKYGKSCPKWFLKKFSALERGQLFSWFLADALGIVLAELNYKRFKVVTSKNWRKSRFTSARDILRERLRTCGTLALLVACGLKSLGIPTKLVHGYFKNPKEKFRHAWNEIYFPEYKKFLPLDITRLNYKITPQHMKVKECIDWEELEGPKWDVHKHFRKLR